MTPDDLLAALSLPREARVDQRVPKKMLVERAKATASDKRLIQEGIEEILWNAALKPSTIGVPEFRDSVREYLEISVLTVTLRPPAKSQRLIELLHRSIPYPLLLIVGRESQVGLSLAHKRSSLSEAGSVVMDGESVDVTLNGEADSEIERPFLDTLALAGQPRSNLFALQQGWIDRVETLLAARLTGRFAPAESQEAAEARRIALEEHGRIQREITALRAQAERETQLNRRVELNLAIRRRETELAKIAANL